MSRFRKTFACWFVVLMLGWLAANLAGVVRPMEVKPFRCAGFPFMVAGWGTGIDEFFEWRALVLNAVIAMATSGILAWVCAFSRRRDLVSLRKRR